MLVYLILMPLLIHLSTSICRFTLARTYDPLLTYRAPCSECQRAFVPDPNAFVDTLVNINMPLHTDPP